MTLQGHLSRHLAAIALSFVAGLANAQLFSTTTTDLAREVSTSGVEGKFLAVLLEQEDCHACRQLRNEVLTDKVTAKDFSARYRTIAVNLAADGELVSPDGKSLPVKGWAQRLRVVGTPAIAFFDGKGRLLYRHVGTLASGRELQLLGRYVVSEEYERRPFAAYLKAQKISDRVSTLQQESVCRTKS